MDTHCGKVLQEVGYVEELSALFGWKGMPYEIGALFPSYFLLVFF